MHLTGFCLKKLEICCRWKLRHFIKASMVENGEDTASNPSLWVTQKDSGLVRLVPHPRASGHTTFSSYDPGHTIPDNGTLFGCPE